MDLMLTGEQVQRNLAALAWLVHSRTSGSHRWRAQRPGNRLEQLDREQSFGELPASGRAACASQPDEQTRTASADSAFTLVSWCGDGSLLEPGGNCGYQAHGVFAFEASHPKRCVRRD
jgi:hypothetical protein